MPVGEQPDACTESRLKHNERGRRELQPEHRQDTNACGESSSRTMRESDDKHNEGEEGNQSIGAAQRSAGKTTSRRRWKEGNDTTAQPRRGQNICGESGSSKALVG